MQARGRPPETFDASSERRAVHAVAPSRMANVGAVTGAQASADAFAASLRQLPPELQAAVLSHADISTFAQALSLQAAPDVRRLLSTAPMLRCALVRHGGQGARYLESLPPAYDLASLRRRVLTEAGYARLFAASKVPGALGYAPFAPSSPAPSTAQARSALSEVVVAPDGQSLAYFGNADFRVHLLHLHFGARRPPAFALTQADRPRAMAYGSCRQRFFVASHDGDVRAYLVGAQRSNEPPQPLGSLQVLPEQGGFAAPTQRCIQLLSPANTPVLLGLTANELLTWDAGPDDDGSWPQWVRQRPQRLTLVEEGVFGRLVHAVAAPHGALLALSAQHVQPRLVQLSPSGLRWVGALGDEPCTNLPRPQALAFAEASSVLGYADHAVAKIFDLRVSLRQPSVLLQALDGAKAEEKMHRTSVLQPSQDGMQWWSGGAGLRHVAWDIRQPRLPFNSSTYHTHRHADAITALQRMDAGSRIATLEEGPKNTHRLVIERPSSAGYEVGEHSPRNDFCGFSSPTPLRNLQVLPDDARLVCHDATSIFCARPASMPSKLSDVRHLDAYPVGAALEHPLTRFSWSRPQMRASDALLAEP